ALVYVSSRPSLRVLTHSLADSFDPVPTSLAARPRYAIANTNTVPTPIRTRLLLGTCYVQPQPLLISPVIPSNPSGRRCAAIHDRLPPFAQLYPCPVTLLTHTSYIPHV
ncbi:hypothetical protein C8R43DRAFT_1238519, partial [Mycena crocata]